MSCNGKPLARLCLLDGIQLSRKSFTSDYKLSGLLNSTVLEAMTHEVSRREHISLWLLSEDRELNAWLKGERKARIQIVELLTFHHTPVLTD